MASDDFRFAPLTMHDSAKYRVAYEIRREPTRSEVSTWFREAALRDAASAPGETAAWLARKLRWFAAPTEPASSYSFGEDRGRVPLLWLAFVPTWILVALAAAAPFAGRAKRIDLLLGPGALVAAHAVACTLVFPLSHYRSGAVPALAVMAGVTVAAALAAERGRRTLLALTVAAAVAIAGALPPQVTETSEASKLADDAHRAMEAGRHAEADDLARRALALWPDDVQALSVRVVVANFDGRWEDARALAATVVAKRPWDPAGRLDVALADARLGRFADALREADEVVALYPWSVPMVGWRGAIRVLSGDMAGGREDLRFAMSRGIPVPDWALEKAGL
jgi:tetratricopeptide (TPR) repeat protein